MTQAYTQGFMNKCAEKETYESGEGKVESYKKDKTEGHDKIVLRLKDGRRVVISNNTKLGIRVEPKEGDEMNYHGYGVKGTNVVHKVHPNKRSRGGWLEHVKKGEAMRKFSYEGLMKLAQSLPVNKLKFSQIRRWVKAMRGMKRGDIKRLASSAEFLSHFPSQSGTLRDPTFRRAVFPKRSLFRGSTGFLSGGSQTSFGIAAEDLEHLPKMLYQNATGVPNYATMYGDVINVFNTRKLKGFNTGSRVMTGDRGMYGVLTSGDPTKPVKGLFQKGFDTRQNRMSRFNVHASDFDAINAPERGPIETLVESMSERPQRVYKKVSLGYLNNNNADRLARYYDVTPLERFYRSVPDSAHAAQDRENLQTLIRYFGRDVESNALARQKI